MAALTVEEARKRISRVKFDMMKGENIKKTRFFSSLLAQMKIKITEGNSGVPTAATDGISVFYSTKFMSMLDRNGLIFVTLHELAHVMFEHLIIGRNSTLDRKLLNIAGDHMINLWLIKNGFDMPLDEDGEYLGLADPRFSGMSTMQIYRILEQEMKDGKKPEGYDDFEIDCLDPTDGTPDEAKAAEVRARITNKVIRAATEAQMTDSWGSVPAEIRQAIEKLNNRKLPWNKLLRKHLTSYAKDDYNFNRFSRRYLHQSIYLPSLHNPAVGGVLFAADVSGSMYGKPVNKVLTEIETFWKTVKPEWLHVMSFDVKVHLNQRFTKGQSLPKLEIVGGGGTNVEPILDYCRKHSPRVAIIMTDGDFAKPDMSGVKTDVIWVIVSKQSWTPPRRKDQVFIVPKDY
jgi:predicted metal-dependent peptidase